MYLTRFCVLADMFLMPQPNTTKPPLQVLAVIEGKSEKIRFRINHVLGKYIGLNIKSSTHISHCVFSHFLSMAGLESGSLHAYEKLFQIAPKLFHKFSYVRALLFKV